MCCSSVLLCDVPTFHPSREPQPCWHSGPASQHPLQHHTNIFVTSSINLLKTPSPVSGFFLPCLLLPAGCTKPWCALAVPVLSLPPLCCQGPAVPAPSLSCSAPWIAQGAPVAVGRGQGANWERNPVDFSPWCELSLSFPCYLYKLSILAHPLCTSRAAFASWG